MLGRRPRRAARQAELRSDLAVVALLQRSHLAERCARTAGNSRAPVNPPVRDRQPRLGRHHADGARRAACGSACGPRRPTPRAAARTSGCSPSPSPAPSTRYARRRSPPRPSASSRSVVPLSPHQVNRRVQVLAAAPPAAGAAPRWSPATPRPLTVEDGAVARLFGGSGQVGVFVGVLLGPIGLILSLVVSGDPPPKMAAGDGRRSSQHVERMKSAPVRFTPDRPAPDAADTRLPSLP